MALTQLAANRAAVNAAEDSVCLADLHYRGGIDSFLASLDAHRTLLARQLIEANKRVSLYRALGGEAAGQAAPAD
jgi:multidrug efflux system outer membrane protein